MILGHSLKCLTVEPDSFLWLLQDFWNLIDLVTFVMAIITIAMYAMKKVFGAVAMSVLEETGSGACVCASVRARVSVPVCIRARDQESVSSMQWR